MPFVTWWHFILLDAWTSPSWETIKGWQLSLNIVCVLCLLFNYVLYIYLRMSHMILITLSQVLYTRFLCPRKGDNGWLVVAIIALLVIVWLIIIKKPSLWQHPHVLWLRLWSKNPKLMMFSFDILMFLHLLFSLNCLIPPQAKTWHPFLCWEHYQKIIFSLMHLCYQSHPPSGEY